MTTCFCHRPDRNCEKCRAEAGRATYSVDTRMDAERERDQRLQESATVTVAASGDGAQEDNGVYWVYNDDGTPAYRWGPVITVLL